MNTLRDFGAGGAILAATGLSLFEIELVAVIERAVNPPQAPVSKPAAESEA